MSLPNYPDVAANSHWTLRDQDFRLGLNYWHVTDEDLIVRVTASFEQGVQFEWVAHPDREPGTLSQEEFAERYCPLGDYEQELLEKMTAA